MREIREKKIMMPVEVLGRNCEHCEMLDIRVITEKLYADGKVVGFSNSLRCSNVYQCIRQAKMVMNILKDEE